MNTPARFAFTLLLSLALVRCSGGGGADGSSMDASDAPSEAGGDTTDAAPAPRIAALAGGSIGHTCALLADGTISCWGLDDHGQLGIASASQMCTYQAMSFPCESMPHTATHVPNVRTVVLGNGQTCALTMDGTVFCWGANDAAQLGLGSFDGDPHSTPSMVLTGARAIAVGAFHGCAIMMDGSVKCWGADNYGQIGIDPTMAPQTCSVAGNDTPCATTPVTMSGLTNVVELALGRYHSCARMMDGSVKCWGLNDVGQLGIGMNDTNSHFTPEAVTLPPASALGAGGSHTCAVLTDGTLRCWGWNDFGQLGVPAAMTPTCTAGTETFGCVASPTAVSGLTGVRAVGAGRGHTCALMGDATVQCWGRNDNGQLGIGSASLPMCSGAGDMAPCSHTPQAVVSLSSAAGIAVDDFSSCAWRMDGTGACWGWNVYGQLGDGSMNDRNQPVEIAGF